MLYHLAAFEVLRRTLLPSRRDARVVVAMTTLEPRP